jgi:CheY-like chemotaxis protein
MTNSRGPILVVEDIPNVLELLEVTLRFQGYEVISARNGQEALDILEKENPALIITDILMPKLDGFALVQKLRSDPKTLTIPVIFLSATYVTPEDRAFAMSLGASRFIEKPIDTEEFLLTIAELLSQEQITIPRPLEQPQFYTGYRARLEIKLQHKNRQIARIERLLPTLDPDQKASFRSLYEQALRDRSEIQAELDTLRETIKKPPHEQPMTTPTLSDPRTAGSPGRSNSACRLPAGTPGRLQGRNRPRHRNRPAVRRLSVGRNSEELSRSSHPGRRKRRVAWR